MLNLDFELIRDPSPYAIIRPALPEGIYALLEHCFPNYDQIVRGRDEGNNKLLQYHAADVVRDYHIDSLWRYFFRYHTSPEFLDELSRVLPIYEHYPQLRDRPCGMRYRDHTDIQMDCLFGMNTKVKQACSVKGPHLDNPHELFACLIYFPIKGDTAGGDLNIYQYTTDDPEFYGQRFTDDVEIIDTIPYERNTAILFLNTPDALHGVTPRLETDIPRRYINIETEVNHKLFKVPGHYAPQG